ncbi:MAG: hypothetical protein JNL21_19900 [Myxococcales bacterium]|nr:hypothetical protein [Myxococcales bacterium]
MTYDSVTREELRVAWEIVEEALEDMQAMLQGIEVDESKLRKHLMNRLLWTESGREILRGVMDVGRA